MLLSTCNVSVCTFFSAYTFSCLKMKNIIRQHCRLFCSGRVQFTCAKTRKKSDKYPRSVVVTGIGMVSPLGCGSELVWTNLLSGICGVTNVKGDGYEKIGCKVAAYVPRGSGHGEFDEPKYKDRSKSLMTAFAMAAADEALKDAKWTPETEDEKWRTGVSIGVGMVELDYIYNTGVGMAKRGPRTVSPHFVPVISLNTAAGHIAIHHQLKGPNICASTACATGAHAIGDAARLVAHGDCDVMVAGGAEASISPLGFAGFGQIRALSTKYNETPKTASRPFHPSRDGFVMGEGAAVLVLEEEGHAQKRGAEPYARVAGYGLSADAENIVSPSVGGHGAQRAMQSAIRDAQLRVTDVTYINAHATSTPLGDLAEATAIDNLFEGKTENLAVSSTKGAVGHLLGGAGAIESAFTVLACYHSILPPTLNLDRLDPGINFNCVPLKPQTWGTTGKRAALSNSFGFGGTNASLCFTSV